MTMSVVEEEKGEINLKLTKFEDKEIDFDLNTLQNAWLSKTAIATRQIFISHLNKKGKYANKYFGQVF